MAAPQPTQSRRSEEATAEASGAPPENGRPGAERRGDASSADSPSREMTELLLTICNSQRRQGEKFCLLSVSEEDRVSVEEYDRVEDLAAAIRRKLGRPYYLIPFLGRRLSITRGPYRYLRTPCGSVPLFDLPDENGLEDEPTGWVGEDDPDGPRPPAASGAAPRIRSTADGDDVPEGVLEADDEDSGDEGDSDDLDAALFPEP